MHPNIYNCQDVFNRWTDKDVRYLFIDKYIYIQRLEYYSVIKK